MSLSRRSALNLQPAPQGVTIEQTLERLQIAFPATARAQRVPQRASGWRLLGFRLALEPYRVITYFIIIGSMLVSELAELPGWMTLSILVFIALIVFTDEGPPREVTRRQSVAKATVELSAHRLVIDARDGSMDLALDQIEKVTVDAAGARLRVAGEVRYLLPSRMAAEREWLGALLQDAVKKRAQHSQTAEADRLQLQAMLSQKQP